MALGKEMFQNFSNESLPRAMGRPSAKDPSLPRGLVIALGKEAEFFFCFLHSISWKCNNWCQKDIYSALMVQKSLRKKNITVKYKDLKTNIIHIYFRHSS